LLGFELEEEVVQAEQFFKEFAPSPEYVVTPSEIIEHKGFAIHEI
jgi:hypothetical protein